MNPTAFREDLEADYETELSRLGSSKSMYAATAGEMDTNAVLDAMAERAHAAAETFDAWTAETTDTVLADAYGSIAGNQRDHVAQLVDAGAASPGDDSTGLEEYLRTLDRPSERAGGLLAWVLVTDTTLSQAVGFFVGNADPSSADMFRDLRSELESIQEQIETLLSEVCAEEGDWDRARDSAAGAIEAAYDYYVETLEDLGVKVKPVC